MPTIYLGGAFAQFTPQQVEERQNAFAALLHPSIVTHRPRHNAAYPAEIGTHLFATLTERDKHMVKQADVLVLDCSGAKEVSRGSMVEVGWASAWGKPVILIAEPGNPNLFAMSQHLANFIVASPAEAAAIANSLLT